MGRRAQLLVSTIATMAVTRPAVLGLQNRVPPLTQLHGGWLRQGQPPLQLSGLRCAYTAYVLWSHVLIWQ